MPKRRMNLVGHTFGMLEVLHEVAPSSRTRRWRCRCKCGKEVEIFQTSLQLGSSKSCGCQVGVRAKEVHTTHGGSRTRLYSIWTNMRARCVSRETSVYKVWADSFEVFREWAMASGYTDKYSMQRYPNKEGNYEPSNCRWILSTRVYKKKSKSFPNKETSDA